jgi:NADH-quinone oxidoreductase subunit H
MDLHFVYSGLYEFLYSVSSWLLWLVGRVLGFIGVDSDNFFYPLRQFITDQQLVLFVTLLLVALIYLVAGLLFGIQFIWMDRKFLGRFMDRRGTQVGFLGFFQNFADAFKVLLKAVIIPKDSDKRVYQFAIFGILAVSFMLLGLVPWDNNFYAVNVPLALLLGLAVFSLAPFTLILAGWSSNNKYTVIGGIRGAAQLIAYEVPLLLVVVSVVIMTGTLNFGEMISWQENNVILFVPLIIGAVVFFIAGLAEAERVPFDLPEAEAELVEGWQTEYGSLGWGLVMCADYLRAYVISVLFAILFLGGWSGPDFLPGSVWMLAKASLVFFFMIWARAANVRIRTDQLLRFCWNRLLPLAVINLVVAVLIRVYSVGWW